jgi:hypothetical protein
VRRGRDDSGRRDVSSRGREVREDRSANVTPIRPYSEPAPMSAYAEPAPRAPQQAPLLEPSPERGRPGPIDFVSPFEDELDEPAFLRKRRAEKDEEEEREQPAFLRRSAD